jgi:hypothetical protein
MFHRTSQLPTPRAPPNLQSPPALQRHSGKNPHQVFCVSALIEGGKATSSVSNCTCQSAAGSLVTSLTKSDSSAGNQPVTIPSTCPVRNRSASPLRNLKRNIALTDDVSVFKQHSPYPAMSQQHYRLGNKYSTLPMVTTQRA